jgi:hypothetical protein
MLSVVFAITVRRMMTSENLYSAWLSRTGRTAKWGSKPSPTGEFMAVGPLDEDR